MSLVMFIFFYWDVLINICEIKMGFISWRRIYVKVLYYIKDNIMIDKFDFKWNYIKE